MLLKIGKWTATVLVVLFLTIYFVRAFDSRRMPVLAPEHRISFDSEFEASLEEETDWQTYLGIEKQLAAELAEKIPSESRAGTIVDRYSTGSLTSPESYRNNWNLSYEISVPSARGVAVLLHGLTDSPYSMLATAETMAGAGYNVVVPRMPGHGFAVGGLRQAQWEDWTAAVRVAVRHAITLPGGEQRVVLAGYSNGGLLAIDYALRCDSIDDLPCPNGIVLLSPAISVSPAAIMANMHSAVSWTSFFDRFQWQSILPEVDPFKFTSFPKRAGWQIHQVSKQMHKKLAQPEQAEKLPPILAFQSVVDNTIDAAALVDILFRRLPANGSELVAYDVNRSSQTTHLMKAVPGDPVAYFESLSPSNFGVTILRNRNPASVTLDAWRLEAGQEDGGIEPTTLRWPRQIYSLSHIAIPFRPDDPVYGDGSFAEGGETPGIVFGALAPRGERGMLRLSADYFMRTRYNPFFVYQAERLGQWLGTL